MTTVDDVLSLTLRLAVPLRIAELAHALTYGGERHQRRVVAEWALDAAEVLAHNGDSLMFKTSRHKLTAAQLTPDSCRKPGDEVSTAATFSSLAKGLAALAQAPGGVRFGGVHWCSESHQGGTTAATADLTCGEVMAR
jgi:hypothetical protein